LDELNLTSLKTLAKNLDIKGLSKYKKKDITKLRTAKRIIKSKRRIKSKQAMKMYGLKKP